MRKEIAPVNTAAAPPPTDHKTKGAMSWSEAEVTEWLSSIGLAKETKQ